MRFSGVNFILMSIANVRHHPVCSLAVNVRVRATQNQLKRCLFSANESCCFVQAKCARKVDDKYRKRVGTCIGERDRTRVPQRLQYRRRLHRNIFDRLSSSGVAGVVPRRRHLLRTSRPRDAPPSFIDSFLARDRNGRRCTRLIMYSNVFSNTNVKYWNTR